jgi:hypothetical protein
MPRRRSPRHDIRATPFPSKCINLPFTKRLVPISKVPSGWKGAIYILYDTKQNTLGPVSDPHDFSTKRRKGAINSIVLQWQAVGTAASASRQNRRTLRSFFRYHRRLNRQTVRKVVGIYGLV